MPGGQAPTEGLAHGCRCRPILRSVRGLSLTSFSSELFCYMVSVSYNIANGYAFSTFGDTGECSSEQSARSEQGVPQL